MRLIVSLFTIIDENKFYELLNCYNSNMLRIIETVKMKDKKVATSLIQKTIDENILLNFNFDDGLDEYKVEHSAYLSVAALYFYFVFENLEVLSRNSINDIEIIIPESISVALSNCEEDRVKISNFLTVELNKLNESMIEFHEIFDINFLLIFVSILYNAESLPLITSLSLLFNTFRNGIDNFTMREAVELRSFIRMLNKHDFKLNFSPLINKKVVYENLDFLKSINFSYKPESTIKEYRIKDNIQLCFHAYELNKELLSLLTNLTRI